MYPKFKLFTGCTSRFTHANRHCPDHPYITLRRESTETLLDEILHNDENSEDVNMWLQRSGFNSYLQLLRSNEHGGKRDAGPKDPFVTVGPIQNVPTTTNKASCVF